MQKDRLAWLYRKATHRSRPLPDFLLIGAMRSGTTSLYSYLSQHPQILQPCKKEVHYFDLRYDNGQPWYRAHFPFRRNLSNRFRTFEASPLYIYNPQVPRRIYDLIPEVKVIAVLRNPTERAISHYFLAKSKGWESAPIYEAMQREEDRLASAAEKKDYTNASFICLSYKRRGLYKEQIERFFKYFMRRQILILSSEQLFKEPGVTLERVFEFVGVDKRFKVGDLKPRNVASNRVSLAAEVYDYLDDFFLPHNRALYGLVHRDFGWENGAA